MSLLQALMDEVFEGEQAGGETVGMEIYMCSSTLCSAITRYSTCGGDATIVGFDPPLPLERALFEVRQYTGKGRFKHEG